MSRPTNKRTTRTGTQLQLVSTDGAPLGSGGGDGEDYDEFSLVMDRYDSLVRQSAIVEMQMMEIVAEHKRVRDVLFGLALNAIVVVPGQTAQISVDVSKMAEYGPLVEEFSVAPAPDGNSFNIVLRIREETAEEVPSDEINTDNSDDTS